MKMKNKTGGTNMWTDAHLLLILWNVSSHWFLLESVLIASPSDKHNIISEAGKDLVEKNVSLNVLYQAF